MNSILKALPQKQLSLQGLRKGQSISNNVKKDRQKSYQKTIKTVQWTTGKLRGAWRLDCKGGSNVYSCMNMACLVMQFILPPLLLTFTTTDILCWSRNLPLLNSLCYFCLPWNTLPLLRPSVSFLHPRIVILQKIAVTKQQQLKINKVKYCLWKTKPCTDVELLCCTVQLSLNSSLYQMDTWCWPLPLSVFIQTFKSKIQDFFQTLSKQ